jgi:hypothetical protein
MTIRRLITEIPFRAGWRGVPAAAGAAAGTTTALLAIPLMVTVVSLSFRAWA